MKLSQEEQQTSSESNRKMTSWAALELLPTLSRARRGILLAEDQEQNREIDVKELGLVERKNVLEKKKPQTQKNNEKNSNPPPTHEPRKSMKIFLIVKLDSTKS
ncbi:hypothetical protein PS2_027872 [Malus domestica]